MDLNWIRQEVSKDENDIDWMSIIDVANILYKDQNKKTSLLGLSKGFVNFIKSSPYSNIIEEIKSIYPNAKIFKIKSQSEAINLIKSVRGVLPEVNRQVIMDEIIVFISDKNTIETAFNRYKLPYIKYIATGYHKKIVSTDGKSDYKNYYRWKRDGEKSIVWERGQGKSIKRDNLLDELFK